jgi:vacuolar-type H+-ATPase subunit I/STV1
MGEIEEIETEIDQLRSKKQRAETEVNELQSIIRFNKELLEEGDRRILQPLRERGRYYTNGQKR